MCATPRCDSARPTCVGWPRIHLAARLGRVKVMAAAIGIQAQWQAMAAKHLQQGPERRGRAFFLYQQSRIDLTRRIIHRHHEIEPRCLRQPRVPRCILMQHHARQRTARPLAPVRTATRRLRQQIAALQKRLGPAVAPGKPMISHQVLVEMPRREAPVACPVQMPRPPRTDRPEPACPTPCQSGGPAARPRPPPRNGGSNGGTSAPPCPAILPPPVGSVHDASQRPNTSTNLSIRTPCRAAVRRILPTSRLGTRYRTVRVLPKPVISSATDTTSAVLARDR